jgi:hypothetical protein
MVKRESVMRAGKIIRVESKRLDACGAVKFALEKMNRQNLRDNLSREIPGAK